MSFGRCGSSNLWLSGSHCLCLETSRYGLYLMARESCLKTLEGHISSVLTAPFVTRAFLVLWLVLGVFLMATMLRMYATCQQLQAQAQAHAAAASGLLGHTELRLHMPPSIALASRGRLRLQLALLDREFDDLDYETLRALDSDNVSTAPSMSEEEINALPVHKYKVSGPQKRHRIIQMRLETQKPLMMSSLAVYDWSKFMLEMYFVACPPCFSLRLVALIPGCGNKGFAVFILRL